MWLQSFKQLDKLALRLWAICTHLIHILHQAGTFELLSPAKLIEINLDCPLIRPYLTNICRTSTYVHTISRFISSESDPCSSSNLSEAICIGFQCEHKNPVSRPMPNQKHSPSPSKSSNPNLLNPQPHQIWSNLAPNSLNSSTWPKNPHRNSQ